MLACLTLALLATAAATPLPKVIIDAGHGGMQLGAVGVCGAQEKEVTLAVAKALGQLLTQTKAVETVLTRGSDFDMTLEDRVAFAAKHKGDLFVSIHANSASNNTARGFETYFLTHDLKARHKHLVARENEGRWTELRTHSVVGTILQGLQRNRWHHQSQSFATSVQETMSERLGLRNRGVLQAPFYVLRDATMPAILVELGFLSHPTECKELASQAHQQVLATGLAEAVLTFAASLPKTSAVAINR